MSLQVNPALVKDNTSTAFIAEFIHFVARPSAVQPPPFEYRWYGTVVQNNVVHSALRFFNIQGHPWSDEAPGFRIGRWTITDNNVANPSRLVEFPISNPGAIAVDPPTVVERNSVGGVPVPTATLLPTATPAPVCSPRPRVDVAVAPATANSLQVTVNATSTTGGSPNRLRELRFTRTDNAVIDVTAQVGRSGSFSVPLSHRPTVVSFLARRLDAGAITVHLTIADDCGDWPTFVGGGAGAF
jgi:hypothetical protein